MNIRTGQLTLYIEYRRAGTITAVGVVVALGYMFYRKGEKKGTAPLGASQ